MRVNYKREDEAWKTLPKKIREAVAVYVFRSAIKSNLAVILYRCEQKHWSRERMRSLFYEVIGLYSMRYFGRSISDTELMERYEKMLGIDFSAVDEAVSVTV